MAEPEPKCTECGFSMYSREHLEGRFHGPNAPVAPVVVAEADGAGMDTAALARLSERMAAIELAVEGLAAMVMPPPAPEPPLARMNKTELRAVAEGEGLFLEDGMTNAEMADAIQAARDKKETGTQPEE